jgi:hypothetical protein
MAQHFVGRQDFWRFGRGPRHTGHNFTPGLMSRLTLQVGHFAFMRLIFLSLDISSQAKGTSDSTWPMNIPGAVGSSEISGKKRAITLRDPREFYAHSETRATLIGSKDR